MNTKQALFEELQAFIANTLGLEPERVTQESKLVDLSTDSIKLFELLMAFEKSYDFEVAYEDVIQLRTVDDIVEFVHRIKQTAI